VNIEQEAIQHVLAKKKQFKEALREHTAYMEMYLQDNLHPSDELDNSLRQLQACVLWAEEAANMYGIK
jgi:hypothetical protein